MKKDNYTDLSTARYYKIVNIQSCLLAPTKRLLTRHTYVLQRLFLARQILFFCSWLKVHFFIFANYFLPQICHAIGIQKWMGPFYVIHNNLIFSLFCAFGKRSNNCKYMIRATRPRRRRRCRRRPCFARNKEMLEGENGVGLSFISLSSQNKQISNLQKKKNPAFFAWPLKRRWWGWCMHCRDAMPFVPLLHAPVRTYVRILSGENDIFHLLLLSSLYSPAPPHEICSSLFPPWKDNFFAR